MEHAWFVISRMHKTARVREEGEEEGGGNREGGDNLWLGMVTCCSPPGFAGVGGWVGERVGEK